MTDLFLSMQVTFTPPTYEFGIVGMMKFSLGTEQVDGNTVPVSITTLVQVCELYFCSAYKEHYINIV